VSDELSDMEAGPQPLDVLMQALNLKNNALVAASTEQLTHKMVAKGRRGRRLTRNIQQKILNALNKLGEKQYRLEELFNYAGRC